MKLTILTWTGAALFSLLIWALILLAAMALGEALVGWHT